MNIFHKETDGKPLEIGHEFAYVENQVIHCPRCGTKMSIIGAGDSFAEESWQCGKCATVATIEITYGAEKVLGHGTKHEPVSCKVKMIY